MAARLATFSAFAILLIATPVPVTAQSGPQRAEDASAAAKYNALNLTKDPTAAQSGEYKLDPRHTSVTVKLAHMDLARYTLRFNGVKGRFAFDPVQPAASKVEIVIDPKSIDTGDAAFDRQIASRYIEADKYPAITFSSTSISYSGDHGALAGILDFHGVKRPVVLELIYRGFTSLDNQPRMGFSGETTFKRSDFGVGVWAPLEADQVTVLIETEFVKA